MVFLHCFRTVKEKRKARGHARKEAKTKLVKRAEVGWDFIDTSTQSWYYEEVPLSHNWAIPVDRHCNTSLRIFLSLSTSSS